MTIYNYRGLKIDSEELTVDDMPNEVFREIFELCSPDCAMQLLLNMPANIIQVPVKGLCNIEKHYIKKDYDGTTASIRAIARKFGITEGYIRDVLSRNNIPAPISGQMGLFDKGEDYENK